jgi:outer membrane protein assembly factor BamD (BamD/ComL family)
VHVSDRIQDLRAEISEAITKHEVEQAAKLYLELRAIDPNQVLARQTQLDVANQLFSQQTCGAAAEAYELYLRHYPKADQIENVHLICGIIYARYLQRYDKAKEHLEAALPKLHAERDVELAKTELARVAPLAT